MAMNLPVKTYASCIPLGQMNLIFYTRTLWRELATWMNAYIVNTATESGILSYVSERLYRIPMDYGNAFRFIFGTQASDTFVNLLSFHIILMQNVINAKKADDREAVNENTVRLYQNANQIAEFFSELNPFWQQAWLRELLYTYIAWTLESSTAFMSGDYERNIRIFDRILTHTSIMGDFFAEGVFNFMTQVQS